MFVSLTRTMSNPPRTNDSVNDSRVSLSRSDKPSSKLQVSSLSWKSFRPLQTLFSSPREVTFPIERTPWISESTQSAREAWFLSPMPSFDQSIMVITEQNRRATVKGMPCSRQAKWKQTLENIVPGISVENFIETSIHMYTWRHCCTVWNYSNICQTLSYDSKCKRQKYNR